MSYASRSGRAETDPDNPRAFAVCDKCGIWHNLYKLSWQRVWAGTTQINIRILACEICLDELQPQLRTVILPPDPPPIMNVRPEVFSLDESDPLRDRKGNFILDRTGAQVLARF